MKRPHDSPDYRRRRRQLMQSITPATRCWRCGRLASEHPLHADGRPGRWQAGHTVDGRNDAPLAAEFSTCNTSAGGKLGNARRWSTPEARERKVGPHYSGHYGLRDDAKPAGWPPCRRITGTLCAQCLEFRQRNPERAPR